MNESGKFAWDKTFTALNEANVAVNTVDPTGVHPRGPGIFAQEQIAEDTGGRAYFGRNDADEIRGLFSELIGKKVDDSFLLIPPFYTAGGDEIRVGRNVFVNQNCTFYDLGGLDIADDVMIGPNVSIITAGHPLEPSLRRNVTVGKPIVIEKNVWIAAGATIIGGVTVGENAVVAAGSVVTKDVPPNTLVGGNPARVIRAIGG